MGLGLVPMNLPRIRPFAVPHNWRPCRSLSTFLTLAPVNAAVARGAAAVATTDHGVGVGDFQVAAACSYSMREACTRAGVAKPTGQPTLARVVCVWGVLCGLWLKYHRTLPTKVEAKVPS